MTEKTSVAYRLSDQAMENLETIIRATGITKTAAVEMALGLLAEKFKGEKKMSTLKTLLTEIGENKITYVGTIYGTLDGPDDDTDRTQSAVEWLDHISEMGLETDIPIIENPTNRWTNQDGFYLQSGDIWFHYHDQSTERVFILT